MTYVNRYQLQNTKGAAGIKKIIREELTRLKYRIQYLFLKYIKYPLS